MQAPTGRNDPGHVRVVSLLCQLCNLLALMLRKLEVSDDDRLGLYLYYRLKVQN